MTLATEPRVTPAARWAIGLTALHAALFVGFFSQEILFDSSKCDVSCGNLLLDLLLVFVTPASWIAAVAVNVVILQRRRNRLVALGCLSVLALAAVAVFVGLQLVNP